MPKYLETAERHSDEALKSRYYKASYAQAKEAVKKILPDFRYEIYNENDDFGEIIATNGKFNMTLKIYMVNMRETSVDIFLENNRMFDFGAGKKHITEFYQALNKVLEFKGLSLHP